MQNLYLLIGIILLACGKQLLPSLALANCLKFLKNSRLELSLRLVSIINQGFTPIDELGVVIKNEDIEVKPDPEILDFVLATLRLEYFHEANRRKVNSGFDFLVTLIFFPFH